MMADQQVLVKFTLDDGSTALLPEKEAAQFKTLREAVDAIQAFRIAGSAPNEMNIAPLGGAGMAGVPLKTRFAMGSDIGGVTPEDQRATLAKQVPGVREFQGQYYYPDPQKQGQWLPVNPSGMDVGDLAQYLPRPAMEAAGDTVGTVLGAGLGAGAGLPGSFLLSALGAGVGGAGGASLYELFRQSAGGVNTQTRTQKLADAGLAFGVGAAPGVLTSAVVTAAKAGITTPILKFLMRHSVGPESKALADDFAIMGIRPTASDITGSWLMQNAETRAEKTWKGSQTYMRNLKEEIRQQTSGATQRTVESFGVPRAARPAGQTFQQGAKQDVFRYKHTAERLYNEAEQFFPPDKTYPVDNVLDAFDALLATYKQTPNLQALNEGPILQLHNALIKDIADINKTKAVGTAVAPANSMGVSVPPYLASQGLQAPQAPIENVLPYQVMKQWRTNLSDFLNPMTRIKGDPLQGEKKLLIGELTKAMEGAAKIEGKDATHAITKANRFVYAYENYQMPTMKKVIDAGLPEEAFHALYDNLGRGPSVIKRMRRALNNDEWSVLQASVLGKMGRGKDGQYSGTEFLKNWDAIFVSNQDPKMGSEMARYMFSGTQYQNLVPELNRLVRVLGAQKVDVASLANIKRFDNSTFGWLLRAVMAPLDLSPLATGAVGGAAMGAAMPANRWVSSAAGFTLGLIGQAAAQNRVAKMLTSPKFVRWLSTGVEMQVTKPNSLPSWMVRLYAIAEAEPDLRDDIFQLLNKPQTVEPGAGLPLTTPPTFQGP